MSKLDAVLTAQVVLALCLVTAAALGWGCFWYAQAQRYRRAMMLYRRMYAEACVREMRKGVGDGGT